MMLNDSSQNMQVELFDAVNRDSKSISKTLQDPDYIVVQRTQCRNALRVLKNCLKKLQEEDLISDH